MATTKKRNGRSSLLGSASGRKLRKRANQLERRTMALRRDAERTAHKLGAWVEHQAENASEAVRKRPTLMIGAMSVAAAGLLGWYLGRNTD